MSSHIDYTGLDLEDFTPPQLRKLMRGMQKHISLLSSKDEKEADEETDKAIEENDSLAQLVEDTRGKSRAPKVTKSDFKDSELRAANDIEDEDDEDIQIASKKKGRK